MHNCVAYSFVASIEKSLSTTASRWKQSQNIITRVITRKIPSKILKGFVPNLHLDLKLEKPKNSH